MAQLYSYFRAKAHAPAQRPEMPLLNDEDEKFLERLTSGEPEPAASSERPVALLEPSEAGVGAGQGQGQGDGEGEGEAGVGAGQGQGESRSRGPGRDAQVALMDGAERLPLPTSPVGDGDGEREAGQHGKTEAGESGQAAKGKEWGHDYLSYVKGIPGMVVNKGKGKAKAGSDLQAAVDAARQGKTVPAVTVAASRDEDENELGAVLDQLNLAAVNNRAFSFSATSQKMMAEFTQILKDLVNGVPTAYDDLEHFLRHWDKHLRKLYADLPPFLQSLVKSLPAKMGSTLAPGLLAAAADKPGADAKAAGSSKKRQQIPSLKKLVGSQTSVTRLLQSILSFLRLRFPAIVTGTNVLMSLAVFMLLFVFWYCHKRGRETRLELERLATGDAGTGDSDSEKTASEPEEGAVLEKAGEDKGAVLEKADENEVEEESDAKLRRIPKQAPPASVPLPAPSPVEATASEEMAAEAMGESEGGASEHGPG